MTLKSLLRNGCYEWGGLCVCVCVCVSLHELFTRRLKNFSPVDTEQWRASVLTSALIQKESRRDFFLSYGSTAAIHGEGRIGFPALKSLSSLSLQQGFISLFTIGGPGTDLTNKQNVQYTNSCTWSYKLDGSLHHKKLKHDKAEWPQRCLFAPKMQVQSHVSTRVLSPRPIQWAN